MSVVARFVRSAGAPGNVGTLIVRADGPIRDLDRLLAEPGHWRHARGGRLSVTGYIAPEAEVFAPRGLNPDMFFASVRISDHQNNALAVADREVDVASNNHPDINLFRRHFPRDAAQFKVIWRSPLIPACVLVVRDTLTDPLRSQLIGFIRKYGKSPGAAGDQERARMAEIPDLGGFAIADNSLLQPFVNLDFKLLREQARHGQWVSEQARQARLTKVEHEHR